MSKASEIFERLKGSRAVGLASSLSKFVSTGMKIVSEEQLNQRIKICGSCEYLRGNEHNPHCHVCGCYILLKARMASEECPIKKWVKVETSDNLQPDKASSETVSLKECCS